MTYNTVDISCFMFIIRWICNNSRFYSPTIVRFILKSDCPLLIIAGNGIKTHFLNKKNTMKYFIFVYANWSIKKFTYATWRTYLCFIKNGVHLRGRT